MTFFQPEQQIKLGKQCCIHAELPLNTYSINNITLLHSTKVSTKIKKKKFFTHREWNDFCDKYSAIPPPLKFLKSRSDSTHSTLHPNTLLIATIQHYSIHSQWNIQSMVFSVLGKYTQLNFAVQEPRAGEFLQQLACNDRFLSFQIVPYKQQEECHTASETANGRKGKKGGTV